MFHFSTADFSHTLTLHLRVTMAGTMMTQISPQLHFGLSDFSKREWVCGELREGGGDIEATVVSIMFFS